MRKRAIVFAGQGSQYEGMGREILREYSFLNEIYEMLKDLKETALNGSLEEISVTKNLQPSILAFQLAVLRLVDTKDIHSTCGLSLGEYSSLVLSKVIDEKTAIEIIIKRAAAMQRASEEVESAMLAVIKVSDMEIKKILKEKFENRVFIANINSKSQIVVSGEKNSIFELQKYLKRIGKKSILLKVSGAFHTEFMKSAREELREELEKLNFKEPSIKYYPNKTAREYEKEDMVELLCEQITSPVLLYETLKNMILDGVNSFLEIGPGNVISNILKREFKDENLEIITLGNDEEVLKFVRENYER